MAGINFADPYDPNAPPRSMADGLGQRMQGMFGGLSRGFKGGANALNPYSNRLMAFSAGMLGGGPSDAMRGLIAGSALDRESADRRKQDEALQGLMGQEDGMLSGFSEPEQAYLAANPDALNAVIAARLKGPDYGETYKGYLRAKDEGYQGDWMQYQRDTKASGVTINTGDYKVPTGYQPADPNDPSAGVEPIPGGPAEQLPAELAARIGLADSFLQEAPAIRTKLVAGEGTGPWDRAQAGLNSASAQAETRRKILSGVDAMKRMLSGAGLPVAEQAEYEARYLPTYTDDATSAAAKLDQLTMELKRVKEVVMRGRGATGGDDEGWTTLPDGRRIREVP